MAERRAQKRRIADEDVSDYYDVEEQLGFGNYAVVYRGVCKETGEDFALKRIDKAKNGIDDIEKEIDVMLTVSNPHCVSLFEVFDTAQEVVLVMEICRGGELFERIMSRNAAKNKFTEAEGATLFRRILAGLKYLHSERMIHRDIKPENILIMSEDDDLDVKLADFNLSKLLLGGDYTTTVLGTMGYCAPEIISHKPYTYSVDIWSLGVLLYVIIAGFPPFPLGKDPMSPIKTKQGKFNFPASHWGHISEEAKDLIRQMLVVNPADRISIQGIEQHPWLMRFQDSSVAEDVEEQMEEATESVEDVGETDPAVDRIRKKLEEILSLENLCAKVAEAGVDVPEETVRRLAKEVWNEQNHVDNQGQEKEAQSA